jgi:4a-hydroxytetrahydrobiopterin dehydratase
LGFSGRFLQLADGYLRRESRDYLDSARGRGLANFRPPRTSHRAKRGVSKGATMAALSNEAIQQGLEKMQGWSYQGKVLQKKFTFKSFLPGIEFVNMIARAAENAGHHPDITINYNMVGIGLSTHSEGGVTEKDFDLAGKIDQIHAALC